MSDRTYISHGISFLSPVTYVPLCHFAHCLFLQESEQGSRAEKGEEKFVLL